MTQTAAYYPRSNSGSQISNLLPPSRIELQSSLNNVFNGKNIDSVNNRTPQSIHAANSEQMMTIKPVPMKKFQSVSSRP